MAQKGYELIFGAGSVGIMGAIQMGGIRITMALLLASCLKN